MRTVGKLSAFVVVALAVAAGAARAQLVKEFNPPPGRCCLVFDARALADHLQDWNQLGRYHADDLKLEAQGPVAGRVVFMGDSITDIWPLAKYFPGKPYVNRGISGQTTEQMLVRMFPDVIDLKPAAVIILAGTNDIGQTTGAVTARIIEEDLTAMTELARAHHIRVILCTLTPVSDYEKVPQTGRRPPADILEINAWIKDYARREHLTLADYYSAVVDAKGFYTKGDSYDGLHPSAQGFGKLAPVAEAAIERALRGDAP